MYFWLIESGQKVKTFTDLHGTFELTNLTFDESNTRIFTGKLQCLKLNYLNLKLIDSFSWCRWFDKNMGFQRSLLPFIRM